MKFGLRLIRKFVAASMLAVIAAPALAQAGKEPVVTREFLIGRWTDNGNCADAVDFRADGTFLTSQQASGRWQLDGGRIRFIGQREVTARIRATGQDRLELTHDDGSVGASTRCVTGRQLSMPALPGTAEEAIRISRPVSDAALLLGNWTDTGDCAATITFHSDGRFTVPTGTGRWQLTGERLSFIGTTTSTARVRAVGNDRILLIHDNGVIGQSLRC